MEYIISFLFVIEFILVLHVLLFTLFKKGVNFKVGISFALLFFIFIPLWIMIFKGKLEISIPDFGKTKLKSIILKENIKSSIVLILFIFSIILYLYFPSMKRKPLKELRLKASLKVYISIYIICMLIIFMGSGLLKGGNWYDNRHNFFELYGSLAILVAFILNSTKILIITLLTHNWLKGKFNFIRFAIFICVFVIFDMVFSGNRIYLFCSAILIGLICIKKYLKKTLKFAPVIIPSLFVFGYFASIFKHMRGPLFFNGIPTFRVFITSLMRAISLEPPSLELFFLGISESVNVNVIYMLFNDFNDFLYGTSYLKPLFFYLPRSIWENKPESITIITAKTYGGASLVSTIIGEMYMNFHLFGILILPVFLWFTDNVLSSSLKKYGDISSMIMFIFGLLIFRMPFSDEFLVFIFILLLLKLGKILRI